MNLTICDGCGNQVPDNALGCGDHHWCDDCPPECHECRWIYADVATDAAEQLAVTAGREG